MSVSDSDNDDPDTIDFDMESLCSSHGSLSQLHSDPDAGDDDLLIISHRDAPYEAYNGFPKPVREPELEPADDFDVIDHEEACHTSANGHASAASKYDFVKDPMWQNEQEMFRYRR